MDVLAGMDFFTVEVLTSSGLATGSVRTRGCEQNTSEMSMVDESGSIAESSKIRDFRINLDGPPESIGSAALACDSRHTRIRRSGSADSRVLALLLAEI